MHLHTSSAGRPRANRNGGDDDLAGGAFVVASALAVVVCVVVVVALVLVLTRRRGSALGQALDRAAAPFGLNGEPYGARGRRYRGAWAGAQVTISVTPGSTTDAEELSVRLPLSPGARPLRIAAAHRLVAALGAHPLPLPTTLGHLVAFGDEPTLRSLLVSPLTRGVLETRLGDREGFDTSLVFAQGELELRVVGAIAARLDGVLLRRLLDDARHFAEAGASA